MNGPIDMNRVQRGTNEITTPSTTPASVNPQTGHINGLTATTDSTDAELTNRTAQTGQSTINQSSGNGQDSPAVTDHKVTVESQPMPSKAPPLHPTQRPLPRPPPE